MIIENLPSSPFNYSFKVRKYEGGELFSLTDMLAYYKKHSAINNLPEKNLTRMFQSQSFLSWLYDTFDIDVKDPSMVNSILKSNNLKLTTGARETKSVWVEYRLFDYIRCYLFEKPKTNALYKFEDKFINLIRTVFNDCVDFRVQEKVLNFRVDLFFPDYGLCVEFDEKYHESKEQKQYDFDKDNAIKDFTGYEVLRVKIGNELQGLNDILKHILTY